MVSTWHRLDGTKSTYDNPQRGEHPRQLWLNPQGSAFLAERAYPNIITGSLLSIAGSVRVEGEMILAGWRRVIR